MRRSLSKFCFLSSMLRNIAPPQVFFVCVSLLSNCTLYWCPLDTAEPLPKINITFHTLMVILSSVPTVLCCLISIYIITGHYLHWVNPKEQKQYVSEPENVGLRYWHTIRIVLCIGYLPVFAFLNFFAGWFYKASAYIVPVLSLYTAKGLIAVFLLYIAYINPEESGRGNFYAGLERRNYYGKHKHDKGSLRWFRVSYPLVCLLHELTSGQIIWVLVFQLVPVTIILFPINYIILHEICPLDSRLEGAEMAMAAVQFVTTTICWNAIFFYYRRTRIQLKNHRGSRKLNAFQTLVALQSIQLLVFPLVTQTSSYMPTKYVSYQDFTNVIPAFMTCWESLIFAVLFIQVFSFTPYRNAVLLKHEHPATVGRAVWDTLDQTDTYRGVIYMFQVLFQRADSSDFNMAKKQYKSEDGDAHELEPQLKEGAQEEILQKLNSDEP